jgi:hypothetical protein
MPRGVHDLGGQSAGPVDRGEHELSLYEKRVDAMMMLLANPPGKKITVDAHRRAQEELSQEEYDNLPYYDRWVVGLRKNLTEAGVLDEGDIDRKIAEIRGREGGDRGL